MFSDLAGFEGVWFKWKGKNFFRLRDKNPEKREGVFGVLEFRARE